MATRPARGAPNPRQLDRYIENGCFWEYHLPDEQLYFKHANSAYLDTALRMGLVDSTAQIVLQLYSEPLARFRLAAQGHGAVQPPEHLRERVRAYCDPLPIWYPPFGEATVDTEAFPLHAITQRPMPMYHSWHSQNAWLRQIASRNFLYMSRVAGAGLGLADMDWVWVESAHGRVRCQLRLVEGVNADTVWTWNAIGKRSGVWNLSADAPEFARGFSPEPRDLGVPRPACRRRAIQQRSGDRSGGMVRPTGKHRTRRCRRHLPRPDALPRPPGLVPPPRILRFNASLQD